MPHPFRFGVSGGALDDPHELVALARRAEELGYASLSLPDHLDEQCGPLVGLTAVAAATESLVVTALVLANDYRHPAVLAKELATLDRFSGGRLECGIGAGWMLADYERAGIPHDRAGIRIERLAEAIAVLKGCFADGAFSFTGDHYSITDLDSQPAPHTRPHPPLLVAGGGPRVLGLAAREADIVGLNFGLQAGVIDASAGPTGTAARTDEKLAVIRDQAGDRFDRLELQTRVHLAMLTDDREGVVAAMAPGFRLTPDEARELPHALVGTVDEICDDLHRRRDRWGISYVTWSADALETMAPVVERLAGT
jgi:probable F420-dependent oxidoreductase